MRANVNQHLRSPWFAALVTTALTVLALAIQARVGLLILPLTFILGPLAAFVVGPFAGHASVGIHLVLLGIYLVSPDLLPTYVPMEERASVQVMILTVAVSLFLIVTMIGTYRRRIDTLVEKIGGRANVDALTGASNRRHGQELLEGELERSRRNGDPVSIILFDLDHFKSVNDDHGHQAGDAVLRGLTTLVRRNLRTYDSLVRWGGEEFLVILPQTGARTGLFIAERLRLLVSEAAFPHGRQVTMSAGVTAAKPGDTLDTMLARADALLYRTKNSGRNRVLAGLGASGRNRPAAEQLN